MTTKTSVYFEAFHELLSVLSNEQLIRFAYRLRKAGKDSTAIELDDELRRREEDGKHD